MLSGIGALPTTLADRSLPIRLKRRTRSEQIVGAGEHRLPQLARPNLPDALDDRAQDAFEPLLAIADEAGGEWPERARAALVALRSEQSSDEEAAVQLLTDIRAAYDLAGVDRLATAALIDRLCYDDEGPWASWHRDGKRLSPRALGRLLGNFGIHSRTIRLTDAETAKGFLREQFTDVWERYPSGTGSAEVTSVTTAPTSHKQADLYPSQDSLVTDGNHAARPHEHTVVTLRRMGRCLALPRPSA
jgi:hypothetical protein